VYKLIPSNGVQHLEDTIASGFTHGNRKINIHTCPSVLCDLEDKSDTATAAEVYVHVTARELLYMSDNV